ncbi:MAG: class F sortase [Dehalococcoidia bacterium]|nr:class F sortase [Dehalococcoidia bacterium]
MRFRWASVTLMGSLMVLALALAWQALPVSGSQAARATGLGAELRYVGRDPLTGMPARVDDRFIAEVERSIERYGKDPGEPVPAPPAGPVDIANLTVAGLSLLDAPVRRYGLDAFGRLDVPQDTSTIGWNPAYNSLPGEGGATFFAAHFEYAGRPGAFNRLSALAPGDEIEVALSDGTRHRYRVTSSIEYALGTIDMGALLHGREGRESITLMTCSGPANEGEYAFRTVVLAERAD